MHASFTPKTVNIYTAFYLPHPGGIERYVYHLALELKRLGYLVNIITTDHEKGRIDVKRESGINIYYLRSHYLLKRRFPIPFSLKQIIRVGKICHRGPGVTNILNTRFFVTTLLGILLGKLYKNKNIVVEHGSGHFVYGNSISSGLCTAYEHLITWFLRLFRPGFYAVSDSSKKWLVHFGIKKTGILSNGVDSEYVNFLKREINCKNINKKIIFYAGRLIKEKGIINLVKAFNEFSVNKPGYYLYIAGAGDLERFVKSASKKSPKKIVFLGLLKHRKVVKVLGGSCVYINPSDYPEGMPTTVLEAVAAGVPVISTRRGSVEKVVKDGVNGAIIDDSSPKEIVFAFSRVFEDYKRIKRNSLRLAPGIGRNFEWKKIVSRFAKIEL